MRQRQWIDIDLTRGTMRWVAAYQNAKWEHVMRLTSKPSATLQQARGDADCFGRSG